MAKKIPRNKGQKTQRKSIIVGAIICLLIIAISMIAYSLTIRRTINKKLSYTITPTPVPISTANWKTYYGDLYTITYPPHLYITESYGKGFANFQDGEGDTWVSVAVDSREAGALNDFTTAKISEKNKLHDVTQTNLPNGIAFTGIEGLPGYQQEYVTYAIYNDNGKALELSIRTGAPISFQKIEPILLKFHVDTPQEIASLQRQTTQQYTSTAFDFQIQYPPKWLLEEDKNSISLIESVNSLGGETGDTLHGGIIRIYPNYNPTISILDFLHQVGEVRITIDSQKNTTINGIPVIWYKKTSQDLAKTKFEGVVLQKDNKYFIIETTYAPQDRQEVIDTLDQIVTSFLSPIKQ